MVQEFIYRVTVTYPDTGHQYHYTIMAKNRRDAREMFMNTIYPTSVPKEDGDVQIEITRR